MKTVLITGGSKGIGLETAKTFSNEGYQVIVTYNSTKITEFDSIQLNVKDDNSIKNLLHRVKEKYEEIDVLVNNAGVIAWKPLIQQSFDEISDQVRTNLEGLIKMTYTFLPITRSTVINISSGAGKTAYRGLSTYCATKFGVRGFTQALAQEIDQKVFCVNPGMTSTQMTGFRGDPPSKVAKVIVDVALGRIKKETGSDVDVWEY